jgi:hypothetical protein
MKESHAVGKETGGDALEQVYDLTQTKLPLLFDDDKDKATVTRVQSIQGWKGKRPSPQSSGGYMWTGRCACSVCCQGRRGQQ